MKDLLKKKTPDNEPNDMGTHAKLKVLGHLKDMASGMMSKSVHDGWAKRSNSDPHAEKSNYNMKGMNTQNDGTSVSQGMGAKDPSVAEHNSLNNEATAEDMNQEHTPESLDAEIARLHEMKRRVAAKQDM
jgi:hypothetical protein